MTDWHKSDWRKKPRIQMPEYTDVGALAEVVAHPLRRQPDRGAILAARAAGPESLRMVLRDSGSAQTL